MLSADHLGKLIATDEFYFSSFRETFGFVSENAGRHDITARSTFRGDHAV